jgi:hypothetical protein
VLFGFFIILPRGVWSLSIIKGQWQVIESKVLFTLKLFFVVPCLFVHKAFHIINFVVAGFLLSSKFLYAFLDLIQDGASH